MHRKTCARTREGRPSGGSAGFSRSMVFIDREGALDPREVFVGLDRMRGLRSSAGTQVRMT